MHDSRIPVLEAYSESIALGIAGSWRGLITRLFCGVRVWFLELFLLRPKVSTLSDGNLNSVSNNAAPSSEAIVVTMKTNPLLQDP
jgi:hypothetical protein